MQLKKLLTMFLLMVSFAMYAGNKTTEVFTLDHQMSQACEKKITNNLRFEKGISDLKVSLKDNTITITFDDAKTDNEKIIQAFKKIGFNAMLASDATANDETKPCTKPCCKEKTTEAKNCKQNDCKEKAAEMKNCCKQKADESKACCKQKTTEAKNCKQNDCKEKAAEVKNCCKQK